MHSSIRPFLLALALTSTSFAQQIPLEVVVDHPATINWDVASTDITLPLKNMSKTPIMLIGAQTTGELFVKTLPQRVEPGKTAPMIVIAVRETTGARNYGITKTGVRLFIQPAGGQPQTIVVPITVNRKGPITFEGSTLLTWLQNNPTATQSVEFTTDNKIGDPASVTPSSTFEATILKIEPGRYRLEITPISTKAIKVETIEIGFNDKAPPANVYAAIRANPKA